MASRSEMETFDQVADALRLDPSDDNIDFAVSVLNGCFSGENDGPHMAAFSR